MSGATRTGTTSPSLPVRGGVAVVLSVLANVVIVLGVSSLGVAPEFRALTVPPVAFLSAAGATGATGVYWLLRRYVSDAERTFVQVAAVVLVLSFVPDLGLLVFDPEATTLGVVVLMAMHVVVAAVSVGLLVYWKAGR